MFESIISKKNNHLDALPSGSQVDVIYTDFSKAADLDLFFQLCYLFSN